MLVIEKDVLKKKLCFEKYPVVFAISQVAGRKWISHFAGYNLIHWR
jgi:hypothetical protein